MLTKFNEQAQKILVISESIAFDLGHSFVGTEHILVALLKDKQLKITKQLAEYEINAKNILNDITRLFGKTNEQPYYIEYSDIVKDILDDAVALVEQQEKNKVTIHEIILSLLRCKECVAVEILKQYHVDIDELIGQLQIESSMESSLDAIPNLVNLNKKVKHQKVNIVGREKEIQQLCQILSKKQKSNALIIGAAGVGKSALVEKLADQINVRNVPEQLQNSKIYELSLASVVAGTKYRGEFEEKFKKIIDKITAEKNIIIFIDEMHNLIGAGGAEGAIDASNILKPYLARADLTIIGATTIDEYYKYFESNQAMNRRFSTIILEENNKSETLTIIKKISQQYSKFHNIQIENEQLENIIDYCDQYIRYRTFPDKAIDILDLACVKAKFKASPKLTKEIIVEVMEEYTKINLTKEIDFNDLAKTLKNTIIGQNQAIDTIINNLKYPITNSKTKGVHLIMGSSGVGKSEFVKVIAQYLKLPLVRLDMSEYKEAGMMNKLLGSPPGYVGYESPSLIIEKIMTNPKCVFLIDEVDKASQEICNLMLQIFDEGYLVDNHKRKIFFNDALIFMTANIGKESKGIGFKKNITTKGLNQYFSDEFVARIDEIVQFKPLSKDSIREIIDINIKDISEQQIEMLMESYQIRLGARDVLRKARRLSQQMQGQQ